MKIKGRYFQAKPGMDTILVAGDYEYVLHQDDSWEKIPAVHTPDHTWLSGTFDLEPSNWECVDWSGNDVSISIDQFKGMSSYDYLRDCIDGLDDCLTKLAVDPGNEFLIREKACFLNQWDVYQRVLFDLLGRDYFFSRTDAYYGVCTEDEEEWLFKVERKFI